MYVCIGAFNMQHALAISNVARRVLFFAYRRTHDTGGVRMSFAFQCSGAHTKPHTQYTMLAYRAPTTKQRTSHMQLGPPRNQHTNQSECVVLPSESARTACRRHFYCTCCCRRRIWTEELILKSSRWRVETNVPLSDCMPTLGCYPLSRLIVLLSFAIIFRFLCCVEVVSGGYLPNEIDFMCNTDDTRPSYIHTCG